MEGDFEAHSSLAVASLDRQYGILDLTGRAAPNARDAPPRAAPPRAAPPRAAPPRAALPPGQPIWAWTARSWRAASQGGHAVDRDRRPPHHHHMRDSTASTPAPPDATATAPGAADPAPVDADAGAMTHPPAGVRPPLPPEAARRVEELTFLAEVAHLAASARTWDELMDTVIDRARAAAHAQVCSLYLTDRDLSGITLAATNGLDQEAVGIARLEIGQGITGLAAQQRRAVTSPDVHEDPRFAWIRGVDQARFTSMCSVPLIWDDAVVGVLNVQTVERREFSPADLGFLEALAGLLAGLVEKSRLHREAAAQLESLRAIDEARANLVAVVTHALRTPLAVVRAYVELLGGRIQASEQPDAATWEHEALAQVDRIDQTVDSILDSLRIFPTATPELGSLDLVAVVAETTRELRPIMRRHTLGTTFTDTPLHARASGDLLKRLLGYLLENASKYAPAGGAVDIYGWREGDRAYLAVTDDGPGIPPEWRERIFEPFVRLDDSPRGAGIGLFAARHLARSMGGDLAVAAREPSGSQFVLDLELVRTAPGP
jgi:signal transduction histidine kinase